MSFRITLKTHLICFCIGLIITFVLGNIANGIVENFIIKCSVPYITKSTIVNFFVIVILLLVPIIALHEAIHGAVYIILGGKVKYGFKGIYAYTMEVSEKPIPRT